MSIIDGLPPQDCHAVSRGCETILVVEDDDAVRAVIMAMLADTGYCILEARDGAEALRICREYKKKIHLLLSDLIMPGKNGRELADEIISIHPGIRVLFMSGYTDDAIKRHMTPETCAAFIEKPFSQADLAAKIREMLVRPV